MPKTKLADPTLEQLAALAEFARLHGRTWKSELSFQWMRAGEGRGYMSLPYGHLLHQLRNTHGPSWLVTFKLPGESVGAPA